MGRPLLPLISVDALTTAALELVDESGDFSFPKLAKRIGVSQSSIYNHVSGRDEYWNCSATGSSPSSRILPWTTATGNPRCAS